MDLIQIDENGLHLVFEKTEDFGCKLLHFSALPFDERSLLHVHDRETGGLRLNTERYNLLEIMISGQNRPGERHGNKYISTSPGDRMKLVYFADKHNEFGRKGPGTNYGILGQIKDTLRYTIVEERSGPGSHNGWGRLKAGGWIALDWVKKA